MTFLALLIASDELRFNSHVANVAIKSALGSQSLTASTLTGLSTPASVSWLSSNSTSEIELFLSGNSL